MSHELREGVKLQSVYWDEGSYEVGRLEVESITIREQTGQMSMVPWAEIKWATGKTHLVNCALLQGVEPAQPELDSKE